MFISIGVMLQLCFTSPAAHVNCRSLTFHTYKYFDLVELRVKDKGWNKKHAKNERAKINEKNFLYYRSWDTNQNDLFCRLSPLGIKFVSHLRTSLFNISCWLDSNACPSQFLHHDSHTLPALFDCLQLPVTDDSSVLPFQMFPWFTASDVYYTVSSTVNPGIEGLSQNSIVLCKLAAQNKNPPRTHK